MRGTEDTARGVAVFFHDSSLETHQELAWLLACHSVNKGISRETHPSRQDRKGELDWKLQRDPGRRRSQREHERPSWQGVLAWRGAARRKRGKRARAGDMDERLQWLRGASRWSLLLDASPVDPSQTFQSVLFPREQVRKSLLLLRVSAPIESRGDNKKEKPGNMETTDDHLDSSQITTSRSPGDREAQGFCFTARQTPPTGVIEEGHDVSEECRQGGRRLTASLHYFVVHF